VTFLITGKPQFETLADLSQIELDDISNLFGTTYFSIGHNVTSFAAPDVNALRSPLSCNDINILLFPANSFTLNVPNCVDKLL
jgi:hypothetical protein